MFLNSQKKKAFTLIEIVIASLLVALSVIPIVNMISQANRSVASIEEETVAFALATEATEWLKALPYKELGSVHAFTEEFIPGGVKEDGIIKFKEEPVTSFLNIDYEPKEQFDLYHRYITIEVPENSFNSLKVTVEIKWISKLTKKKDNSVKLQFMKFKY
ncbi:MAG: hypothetical protein COB02_04465 [Candidatus Cloacimonadota bacterium]|nr:MAG: hypothetical protein COB02_04465 [Candidatus Cloacimonadota bacterium]